MRLGVFGGTFDPPHNGHLIVAQDAYVGLRLDRVLFVPAALPPHKRAADSITAAAVRLEMVHAAVAGDDRFAAEPIELAREGPSYTVDTLRTLRQRTPSAELVLLVGADQFAEFSTWREPDEIVRLARLGVLTRSGSIGSTASENGRIAHVLVTRIDVSSTEIRRRVREGEPIRYLVPAGVEAVIERERLYR